MEGVAEMRELLCKVLGHNPEMKMACRDTLVGPNVYEELYCDRCGESLTEAEFDEALKSWWNRLKMWRMYRRMNNS